MGYIDFSPELLTSIVTAFDGRPVRRETFRAISDPLPVGVEVSRLQLIPETNHVRIFLTNAEDREYRPLMEARTVE